MGSGDSGLQALSEQELLMLQQTPQTSQTHDAISFWLERVSFCFSTPLGGSHQP